MDQGTSLDLLSTRPESTTKAIKFLLTMTVPLSAIDFNLFAPLQKKGLEAGACLNRLKSTRYLKTATVEKTPSEYSAFPLQNLGRRIE